MPDRFGFDIGTYEGGQLSGVFIWRSVGLVPTHALADPDTTLDRTLTFFRVDSNAGANFNCIVNIGGGPNVVSLRDDYESSTGFIKLFAGDNLSVVIPGPEVPTNIGTDTDGEVYRWNVSDDVRATLVAFTDAVELLSAPVREATFRMEFRSQAAADAGDLPDPVVISGSATAGTPSATAAVRVLPIPNVTISGEATAGVPSATGAVVVRPRVRTIISGSATAGTPSATGAVRVLPIPDVVISGTATAGVPSATGAVVVRPRVRTIISGEATAGIPSGKAKVRVLDVSDATISGSATAGTPSATASLALRDTPFASGTYLPPRRFHLRLPTYLSNVLLEVTAIGEYDDGGEYVRGEVTRQNIRCNHQPATASRDMVTEGNRVRDTRIFWMTPDPAINPDVITRGRVSFYLGSVRYDALTLRHWGSYYEITAVRPDANVS